MLVTIVLASVDYVSMVMDLNRHYFIFYIEIVLYIYTCSSSIVRSESINELNVHLNIVSYK